MYFTPRKIDFPEQNEFPENLPKKESVLKISKEFRTQEDLIDIPNQKVFTKTPILGRLSQIIQKKRIFSEYTIDNPAKGEVVSTKRLTESSQSKLIQEMKIKLDMPFSFKPGECVGIICRNKKEITEAVLKRLCLNPEDTFCCIYEKTFKNKFPRIFEETTTIYKAFSILEFSYFPSKRFFLDLSLYCKETQERKNLESIGSKEGSALYRLFSKQKIHLLDILYTFKTCMPPLEVIVEHYPPLHPRYYSVSNVTSNDFSIVFNLEEYFLIDRKIRYGICTEMLSSFFNCIKDKTLYVFPSPNKLFFIKDETRPLLLVSLGTGISPFIFYLRTMKEKRRIIMFHGVRNKESFIYKNEIDIFIKEKKVENVFVSYSREENEKKKYIQSSLSENWKIIYEILISDGCLYFCGSSIETFLQFKEVLKEVFIKAENKTEEEAKKHISFIIKNNQIQTELWI